VGHVHHAHRLGRQRVDADRAAEGVGAGQEHLDTERGIDMSAHQSDPFDMVLKGDALLKAGDLNQAEQVYLAAIQIAESRQAETNYIYAALTGVYKKQKRYEAALDACRLALPSPASFRDSAICLRAIAKSNKASKNLGALSQTLDQHYRLGVLCYLCYADHDCQSAVSGPVFERATHILRRIPLSSIQHTYAENGVIRGGGFLTDRDYSMLSDHFGPNEGSTDFNDLYREIVREENRRAREMINQFDSTDRNFYLILAPFAFMVD
jgi:tetratricopeptide (TPR) repeat protein